MRFRSLEDIPLHMQPEASTQLFTKHNAILKAHSPLPDPIPQPHQTPALGGTIQGETEIMGGVKVRFVGFRVRPLDPDNFAGSVKDLLDGLRSCQLIQGDEPWRITLETQQVKVASFAQEKTTIEITYP